MSNLWGTYTVPLIDKLKPLAPPKHRDGLDSDKGEKVKGGAWKNLYVSKTRGAYPGDTVFSTEQEARQCADEAVADGMQTPFTSFYLASGPDIGSDPKGKRGRCLKIDDFAFHTQLPWRE